MLTIIFQNHFPSSLINLDGDALQTAGRSLNNNWTANKWLLSLTNELALQRNKNTPKNGVIGNITAINYSLTKQTNIVERADFEDYNYKENTQPTAIVI